MLSIPYGHCSVLPQLRHPMSVCSGLLDDLLLVHRYLPRWQNPVLCSSSVISAQIKLNHSLTRWSFSRQTPTMPLYVILMSTVSTKHLAPKPASTSPVQIQPQDCVPETSTVDSSVQQDVPTTTHQASIPANSEHTLLRRSKRIRHPVDRLDIQRRQGECHNK